MKIAICGSMQFYRRIKLLEKELNKMGHIVFAPEEESGDIDWNKLSLSKQIKLKQYFIDTHIEKIKQADCILIANYSKKGTRDYIGANTFLEMAIAYLLKKKIYLLNNIPKQSNELEIRALNPIILRHDLSQLK